MVPVPKLSLHKMEVIESALSHGTDAHKIDNKKACLLTMYDLISGLPCPSLRLEDSQDVIMVSPMRRAGAARLTFDQGEHQFEWTGWNICDESDGASIEMESSITIGNDLWTRYVEGTIDEDFFDCLQIYYTPSCFFPTSSADCRQVLYRLRCSFAVFKGNVSPSRTHQASDKIVVP